MPSPNPSVFSSIYVFIHGPGPSLGISPGSLGPSAQDLVPDCCLLRNCWKMAPSSWLDFDFPIAFVFFGFDSGSLFTVR